MDGEISQDCECWVNMAGQSENSHHQDSELGGCGNLHKSNRGSSLLSLNFIWVVQEGNNALETYLPVEQTKSENKIVGGRMKSGLYGVR